MICRMLLGKDQHVCVCTCCMMLWPSVSLYRAHHVGKNLPAVHTYTYVHVVLCGVEGHLHVHHKGE